jgi:hypothetical protein
MDPRTVLDGLYSGEPCRPVTESACPLRLVVEFDAPVPCPELLELMLPLIRSEGHRLGAVNPFKLLDLERMP